MGKTLLKKQKIVETIRHIPDSSFTVLHFMDAFRALYPQDWERLVERYGLYGEKRRYTATTYLSNRLDL